MKKLSSTVAGEVIWWLILTKKIFIKISFAPLRLADTALAATRFHRQIEALSLILNCNEKT